MQRMTKQRKIIFNTLQDRSDHPGADFIYQLVKEQLPQLSLGTVYRNLEVLTEAGMISKLSFGSGQSRYDSRTDEHYHFRCSVCGRIEDLPFHLKLEPLDRRHPWVKERIVTEVRLELTGICPECK